MSLFHHRHECQFHQYLLRDPVLRPGIQIPTRHGPYPQAYNLIPVPPSVVVETSACSVTTFWKETWKVLVSAFEKWVICIILSIPLLNKLFLASGCYMPDILLNSGGASVSATLVGMGNTDGESIITAQWGEPGETETGCSGRSGEPGGHAEGFTLAGLKGSVG